MPEPVPAQMLAAVPAGDDDDMIVQAGALQHAQDDHARPGLSIVGFQARPDRWQHGPGVMGGAGEFLVPLERLEKGIGPFAAVNRAAGDRVFRPPVTDHAGQLPHHIWSFTRRTVSMRCLLGGCVPRNLSPGSGIRLKYSAPRTGL